ncbi:NAD(+)--arginine ADP-ribosyltransferase Mav [Mycobacterium sp. Aquia_213]|uniref:WXG100-like domain-containing protein n=1 Tax=Mycobacterium sp. Aquia_213 TaxID=2991728 RepID=UPI00226E4263|nr:NAD(+)--arginine ADP-ribosyltransferase Mav [Mycobacterium sp. Aquia_213]WAC90950.1 NAD(+)--arginine ADP-ribosyltransferase Mav [Mycobacterium sp. Aquia_213]
MAPLGVDPVALDGAGAEVVTAAEGLASVISTLMAALSGCAGMAGDDPAGAALGHSYDSSAARLVEAMVTTRNGLCGLGIGVRMSAHNYSLAEAMSNIGGNGGALPPPPLPGPISAGSAPSAVGSSDIAPPGWGWVAPYLGMIWPSGDSAKLRAAATAWTAAGTQFALAEILGTGAPMGAIRAQHIPEGPAIDGAFTAAYRGTTSLVQQCQQIASQLNGYATKVDKVHAAILDLLSRICDPLTGFKEVWDILTDEDEDEIKKIADDIRTVIDNFKSEVKALEAEIAATLAEAETILTTMGDYATRQWDHFLHATYAGRVIDNVGHYAKNVYAEAGEAVVGLYNVSQVRLVLDPVGYFHDLNGTILGALPLVALGPDGSPSVLDSWKALGKDVSHWEQWKTDPVGAAGRSVFDAVTLALPGGPLSKLGTRGRAALDAIKGLKKPPLPKLPDPPAIKPPETPKPPAEGPKAPESGTPAPPKPAPTGTPPPHSPTEPKPPIGEAPKPTAAPPGSGGKPTVPAEVPHPHERIPAHVPASPGGIPGEPVPSAAAPAASAPGDASLPHGGTPHGGEPGVHQPHQPHDGPPHSPGDGQPPHGPGDGTPHQPHDGPPGDLADNPPPIDAQPGRPEFTLDNPLDHMSQQLLVLSEQHLTGSGETVLGPFKPVGGGLSYIDFAELRGASYFDIGDAWNAATPIERLAANQHVLDIAIARGDTVTLSVPFGKIDPNSFTGAEIRYLESHGYHRAGDNKLIPSGKGG